VITCRSYSSKTLGADRTVFHEKARELLKIIEGIPAKTEFDKLANSALVLRLKLADEIVQKYPVTDFGPNHLLHVTIKSKTCFSTIAIRLNGYSIGRKQILLENVGSWSFVYVYLL